MTDGVVRVGDTVRRPRQPWSAAVSLYLRHLERVGFTAVPRWRGVDAKGRDILDHVDGAVPGQDPEAWAASDAVLAGVGRLVRALHDASEGFVPPQGATWFGDDIAPVDLPEDAQLDDARTLVAHRDVTPQNVVFAAGMPRAIIDFDMTGPTTRLIDVVNTAMHWVPLKDVPDRDPAFAHVDVAARLRLLVDAYGLGGEDRARLLDVAATTFRGSWYRMRANADQRGGGWARMWAEGVGDKILRRQRWLDRERDALATALR